MSPTIHLTPTEANAKRIEFLSLLGKNEKEQIYQEYLEKNTEFIPREFIQNHGLHLSTVFRKFPLSSEYIPDFLYISKSSDDWNVVLIEIEKPSSKYFLNNTTNFHNDFTKAIEQMNDWRAWISIPANLESLKQNSLIHFLVPSIMQRNPLNIKYLLVHGRREEYEGNEIRKNKIRSMERDDFKIISFDNLAVNIEKHERLYIAKKTNTHIDILSNEYVDDGIFSIMSPTTYRINKQLHDDTEKKKSHSNSYYSLGVKAIDHYLPMVTIYK
ncbi:Shedu immune nuclease family protein [Providencia manganoxydans]|uniref:Shedu immune nuclease family protein n=1 Tax=Providencia manganoxydans TaxID=2923283 RepID=UPI0032DB8D9F